VGSYGAGSSRSAQRLAPVATLATAVYRVGMPPRIAGNLRCLLGARVVRSAAQAVLTISAPLYLASAGHDALTVGAVLSAGSIGSVVLVLLVGSTADHFGRRRMLVGLGALGCVGAIGFALTTSPWVLAPMAALGTIGRGGGAGSGGSWGPFYPAEQPLVAASVDPGQRNSAFAMLSAAGVGGSAIGSLLAALPTVLTATAGIDRTSSFRPMFVIAAAASAAVVWLAAQIQETRTSEPRAPLLVLPASARAIIGRLWVTNALNGFVMGALGPFLTYWFSIRYGVGPATLGLLYTLVNLTSVVAFAGAPSLAARVGSVRAVTLTRLLGAAFFAVMAVSPGFPLAAIAYALRSTLNAVSMTLRQSFVMGVSDDASRSAVAAFGNLPAQVTGTVTPTLGAYLVQAVSVELPIWLATAAMAINAIMYGALFRRFVPPEERAS
jgi:MFS family permease